MPVESGESGKQRQIPWKQFPKFLRNLLWVYTWSKKQAIGRGISRLYSPIGYIGLTVLAIEIILEFLHVAGWFRHLGHFATMIVLGLLLFLAWHKKRELEENRRHATFLESAHFALTSLDKLTFDRQKPNEGSIALTACLDEILRILLETFAWKGSLNANVMLPEGDGKLTMKFVRAEPGVEYDIGFRPNPGEGGAGLCFQEKAIVYLPDFRRGHAVLIRSAENRFDYTVCLDTYRSVPSQYENYSSILSVPVAAYHACYGVLNLDSRLRDPFRERDYFAVAFFGAIIGLALSRYQSYYP